MLRACMDLPRLLAVATVAALLLSTAAVPDGAAAQGRGVFVDPDSPAGKEYAIPFETARRQAAPGAGEAEAGVPGSAPLFGVGISPRGRGASGGGSGGEAAGRGSRAAGRQGNAGGEAKSPDASPVRAAGGLGEGDGGPPAGILTGAVALGVLLLGGGAGLTLRAVLRRPDGG